MDLVCKQIAEICNKYPKVKKVVLFGSRARGDHNERSDYDIALWTENERILTGLQEEIFETVRTLHKIDITFVNSRLDPNFLNNIEQEGIIIHEKNR